jgi:hypothetical protein
LEKELFSRVGDLSSIKIEAYLLCQSYAFLGILVKFLLEKFKMIEVISKNKE